jgi:hypothetical protein
MRKTRRLYSSAEKAASIIQIHALKGNDYLRNQDDTDQQPVRRRHGGITRVFPMKLHSMLQDLVKNIMYAEIIRWNAKGTAFVILDPIKFTETLLPIYFRTNRWSSFQRQLNAYGFRRMDLLAIHDKEFHTYYHEKFHRDHPDRLELIRRKNLLRIKGKSLNEKMIISPVSKQCCLKERSSSTVYQNIGIQSFVISSVNLHHDRNDLSSDLILDEAAEKVLSNSDSNSVPILDDSLAFWDPESEVLEE